MSDRVEGGRAGSLGFSKSKLVSEVCLYHNLVSLCVTSLSAFAASLIAPTAQMPRLKRRKLNDGESDLDQSNSDDDSDDEPVPPPPTGNATRQEQMHREYKKGTRWPCESLSRGESDEA